MTARIARGSAARRRPPSRAGAARKRRGKTKQPGLLEGLPVSAATARKVAVATIAIVVLTIGFATAVALRLPQQAGTAIGEQVGGAGFTVSRVELRGLDRMDRSTVYHAVLDQPSLAMPLVDLDAIRARLLEYRWIKEARVSRRLPDTLVVEVEERVPAAVWQHNRQLRTVDVEGVPLDRVRPEAMPDLPLVIGPGAQDQVAGLSALLDGANEARPMLAAATWVGERRWDLRFKTGEILSLPEGEMASRAAFQRFLAMNRRRNLLGSSFLRFDMRIEGKMIVQLRQMPDGKVPAPAPVPQGEAPQDLSRTI